MGTAQKGIWINEKITAGFGARKSEKTESRHEPFSGSDGQTTAPTGYAVLSRM